MLRKTEPLRPEQRSATQQQNQQRLPGRLLSGQFLAALLSLVPLLYVSTAHAQGAADEPRSYPLQTSVLTAQPAYQAADQACFEALGRTPIQLGLCEAALLEAQNDRTPAAGANARPSAVKRIARLQSATALLMARNQQSGPARELMNRALAAGAEDPIVAVNNGNLLLREGAFRQALDVYNRVVSVLIDTNSEHVMQAVLYRNRSLALRALGRYDEAQKDYSLYLQVLES